MPAAGGVNSNIKDMSLWMLAQMGEMPQVLSPQLLETIHQPRVKTPGERGRMRKFLERLGEAQYGYGWRSYDYAGHHIIGHRGGVDGYRSLILFDPQLKSGVVALWNSNTSQPGGLEFEVMDMLYGLRIPRLDGARQGRAPRRPEPRRDALQRRGESQSRLSRTLYSAGRHATGGSVTSAGEAASPAERRGGHERRKMSARSIWNAPRNVEEWPMRRPIRRSAASMSSSPNSTRPKPARHLTELAANEDQL